MIALTNETIAEIANEISNWPVPNLAKVDVAYHLDALVRSMARMLFDHRAREFLSIDQTDRAILIAILSAIASNSKPNAAQVSARAEPAPGDRQSHEGPQ